MPKFCANLSMMFTEYDFLERFDKAAKAGFKGVEYLFPYAFKKEQIIDCLDRNGLTQVLHNLPAGDWDAGERGIACLPDRINEFKEGVDLAIEYATALNCKQVNVLAGITPKDSSPELIKKTFIDNINYAADKLKLHGIKLLIEAINTRDIPGFYVSSTQQTLDLISESGNQNIDVQYDIYHMQIMEGDLAPTIKANFASINHIQLADNPGRHEPGTGEINYPFLFSYLDELDYQGWIGCEYKPKTTTEAGLGWFKPYQK